MDKALIGGCGIYCGACDHYVSTKQYGNYLLKSKDSLSKKLAAHPCGGCKSENIETICIYCRNCSIRLCTIEKNIDICSECKLFPCEEIQKFKNNVLEHKKEAFRVLSSYHTLGAEKWLNNQQKRWRCPECKTPHSYYEKECHHCKTALNALFPDRR